MPILKRRLNYNNSGVEQTLHLETSADMVQRSDGSSVEDAIANLDAVLGQINAALAVLNGTGEGSVSKSIIDKISAVVAGAPERLDTLKELADWIDSHETDAATMNSKIIGNSAAIEALQSKPGISSKEITFTASDFVSNVYAIPAATHGLTNGAFAYQVYMLDGTAYKTGTWAIQDVQVSYNADKSITLSASSGFAGKIVLIG